MQRRDTIVFDEQSCDDRQCRANPTGRASIATARMDGTALLVLSAVAGGDVITADSSGVLRLLRHGNDVRATQGRGPDGPDKRKPGIQAMTTDLHPVGTLQFKDVTHCRPVAVLRQNRGRHWNVAHWSPQSPSLSGAASRNREPVALEERLTSASRTGRCRPTQYDADAVVAGHLIPTSALRAEMAAATGLRLRSLVEGQQVAVDIRDAEVRLAPRLFAQRPLGWRIQLAAHSA